MARRWYIPLLAVPVAVGTAVAVLEGVASASPGLTHTTARTTVVQRLFPGTPAVITSGGAGPSARHGALSSCPPTCSSTNWAGYAVSGRNGAFQTVSASWTEPRVNCQGVPGRRFASFWVGLDGFSLTNPPSDTTVEQLGTDADCRRTTPDYYAWWETFPNPSVNLHSPVAAGDHMSASVTFRGAGRFALFIKDSTRHWSRTIITNVASATRATAEVIAEAPALVIGRTAVPQNLANFGTVQWAGSRVNGTPLKNFGRRIHITMIEVKPPFRIRATTSPVGSGDPFTNRFVLCC